MTKSEQIRQTHWRFKLLQRATNMRCVASIYPHFSTSRETLYTWRRRFAEHGVSGLCNRPGTPPRSPWTKLADVVAKILYLRENHHFGTGRFADYLKPFDELSLAISLAH